MEIYDVDHALELALLIWSSKRLSAVRLADSTTSQRRRIQPTSSKTIHRNNPLPVKHAAIDITVTHLSFEQTPRIAPNQRYSIAHEASRRNYRAEVGIA